MAKDAAPRKVVVGSLMYAMYGNWPGVENRCRTLAGFIDEMAKKAKEKYGTGLDIAALPEVAVNGGMRGSAKDVCLPLEGPVLDILGEAARRNRAYVVVPMFLAEDAGRTRLYNVCVLLDRQGKPAGIYRKVHPVDSGNSGQLEGGVLPGREFPVFSTDFGKVGIQICYDIEFEDGWATLAKKGAELVIWSTQSPQIIAPQSYAKRFRYYILSSTWRNNASLFDPTGAVIAQTTEPSSVLVEQIDLTYALIGWQPKLANGKAFADRYGRAAGFRYSEAEDRGIFWSNDPKIPVMRMVRELGLELEDEAHARNRALQDALRKGLPEQP